MIFVWLRMVLWVIFQLIDPVDKTNDRDLSLIQELGLKLVYAMNTHVHADHITGTGLIKVCQHTTLSLDSELVIVWNRMVIVIFYILGFWLIVELKRNWFEQGKVAGVELVISKASGSKADVLTESGDKIHFGGLSLEVIKDDKSQNITL